MNRAGRWFLALAFLVCAFLAGAQAGDACTVDDGFGSNYRSGPSLAFGVVGGIGPGVCDIDVLDVFENADEADGINSWLEIEYRGSRGWMADTRLIVTDTRPVVLTDIPTPTASPTIPPTLRAALTATAQPTPTAEGTPEPGGSTEIRGEVLRWRIVIEISEVIP